jgi:hypothetical protein
MILSDLKRYLQTRGQASLADIALHFRADPQAVRGMLEVWMRKGKVARHAAAASCGATCARCDPAATEVFVWVGEDAKAPPAIRSACAPERH